MPKITIYQRQKTSGGPVDTPEIIQPGAIVGEALQRAGASVEAGASAIFRKTQADEISKLRADSAEFEADILKKLNDDFKQPGAEDDPKFSQKQIENLQKAYDELNVSFDTPAAQRAFDERRAKFSADFDFKATNMQIQLDGERTVKNLARETNAYENKVFQNPELFTPTLADLKESINEKELPADKKQELLNKRTQELAQQAIRGWNVSVHPDAAERQLDNPQFTKFISGDTRKVLLGEIQSRRNFLKRQEKELKQKQDDALDEVNERFKGQLISKIIERKTDPDTLNAFIDASSLDSDDKGKMLNLVDKYLKGPVKSNQLTYSRIRDQIFNGDITRTSQILDVAESEDLSAQDLDWFRTELEGLKGPEGESLKAAKKDLSSLAFSQLVKPGPSGFPDPLGKRLTTAFEAIRRQKETEFRRAGKNIADLYEPTSKDYLGKLLDTPLFNRGIAEKSQSLIDDFFGGKPTIQKLLGVDENNPEQKVITPQAPKSPVPKRKAGESLQDYIKRRKAKKPGE